MGSSQRRDATKAVSLPLIVREAAQELSTDLSQSRRILRLPIAIIVLGVLFWIGGAVMQITSPTTQDSWHSFPFNNHGTLHYLSWPVHYLPWAGFGLGFVGVLMYWILCRRIAKRLGVAVDIVMGVRRV